MTSSDEPRQPRSSAAWSNSESSSRDNKRPALSLESLDFLSEMLRQRSAISLSRDKAYLIESRLMPVARQAGLETIDELVDRLRRQKFSPLHDRVIDAMTTNETSFFRDGIPFEILREKILPELFRKRIAGRQLHIWSAACASGQEPYSLAMLLSDSFSRYADWRIRIIGSDISQSMLQQAREGLYNDLEIQRGLPQPLRDRYFHQTDDGWLAAPELRTKVEFRELNLIAGWPPLPKMDIVLLRNVLVYFDVEARREVLARVRQVLRPDGILLLGGTETTLLIDPVFERVVSGGFSYYVLRPE